MNARRSLLFGSSVILGTLLTLPAAAQTSGPPGGPPSIEAKPVAGVTVAPGKKLWVFVFPEQRQRQGSSSLGRWVVCGHRSGWPQLLGFRPTA